MKTKLSTVLALAFLLCLNHTASGFAPSPGGGNGDDDDGPSYFLPIILFLHACTAQPDVTEMVVDYAFDACELEQGSRAACDVVEGEPFGGCRQAESKSHDENGSNCAPFNLTLTIKAGMPFPNGWGVEGEFKGTVSLHALLKKGYQTCEQKLDTSGGDPPIGGTYISTSGKLHIHSFFEILARGIIKGPGNLEVDLEGKISCDAAVDRSAYDTMSVGEFAVCPVEESVE